MISICIPYIREDGMNRCVEQIKNIDKDIKKEVLVYHDKHRIGCPQSLKYIVDNSSYDIVVFLADDTIPQEGIFINSLNKMKEFDGGWGLIGFNDQYRSSEDHATHWMAHKKLLPYLDGEFFHTGYKHCFCDNELILRCKGINRYKYCEGAKLTHLHPIVQQDRSLVDKDYSRVYSHDYLTYDEKLFIKRRDNNWR